MLHARAPFQVLVFPVRPTIDGDWEYAIFHRADQGFWQGVSGGGEDDETPFQAARRECAEEIGLTEDAAAHFIPLETTASIKVTWFRGYDQWGARYVIPEHAFGVVCEPGVEFSLSDEHDAYRWLPYAEAEALLRFDSNRTAVWELDRRMRGLPAG